MTRKGRVFSEYAVRDLLKTRFYLGVVAHLGTEYVGQHEAIVSEELFQRVAALRVRREPQRRSREGESGILRGMIYCGHCGETVWSESHHSGRPIYRERQVTRCAATKRSAKAETIDAQVAQILESIELPAWWDDLIAEAAAGDEPRADVDALQTRRRRLARAYADGGFAEAEYETRLAAIDMAIRDTTNTASDGPSLEEAASLIRDLPALWSRATQDERRQLVQPLVERVYVDLGSARIGGLQPTPEFRHAARTRNKKSDYPDVRLLTQDEALRWSEVEVELVETGESRTPRPESLRLRSATGVVSGYSRRPSSADEGPGGQPQ